MKKTLFICESRRANPRTINMLANPTTNFLAQIAVAGVIRFTIFCLHNRAGVSPNL